MDLQWVEGIGGEEDDGVEITGEGGTPEVRQGPTEVADRAPPKAREAETYPHRAKGCYMRADTCHFAPLNTQCHGEYLRTCCWSSGQSLVWVPSASATRTARRSCCATWWRRHKVKGYWGGGNVVAGAGRDVWAVALLCGMADWLTPFLVVQWRDMMSL